MRLQESGEMYLETILRLSQQKSFVRAIDVGEYMGFSKPSVSRAIGLLRNGGFVEVGDGGGLSLTETGREIAEKIFERHRYLTKMLMEMGVDEETASEDACRMEHVVSDKSFAAIKAYFHYNEENAD